jgi:hypothetical protein
MDSIERVTKVLRGEVPDRVPVALHGYLMACRMHGGPFDEILRRGALWLVLFGRKNATYSGCYLLAASSLSAVVRRKVWPER